VSNAGAEAEGVEFFYTDAAPKCLAAMASTTEKRSVVAAEVAASKTRV
jgi:hypothetical protein